MQKHWTELETLKTRTPEVVKVAYAVIGTLAAVETAMYHFGAQSGEMTAFKLAELASMVPVALAVKHMLVSLDLKDMVKELKGELKEAKAALSSAAEDRADEVALIASQLSKPKPVNPSHSI